MHLVVRPCICTILRYAQGKGLQSKNHKDSKRVWINGIEKKEYKKKQACVAVVSEMARVLCMTLSLPDEKIFLSCLYLYACNLPYGGKNSPAVSNY